MCRWAYQFLLFLPLFFSLSYFIMLFLLCVALTDDVSQLRGREHAWAFKSKANEMSKILREAASGLEIALISLCFSTSGQLGLWSVKWLKQTFYTLKAQMQIFSHNWRSRETDQNWPLDPSDVLGCILLSRLFGGFVRCWLDNGESFRLPALFSGWGGTADGESVSSLREKVADTRSRSLQVTTWHCRLIRIFSEWSWSFVYQNILRQWLMIGNDGD